MKRNRLFLIFIITVIAACVFSLAACDLSSGNKGHRHVFDTAWQKDATHHWRTCACGNKDFYEPHDYSGGDCECGAKKPHTHTFSDELDFDGVYHWYKATCGHAEEKKDIAEHSFDENGDCVCGFHRHVFLKEYDFDDTRHWHNCVGCDEKDAYAEHVFGVGERCVCGMLSPDGTLGLTYELNEDGISYRVSGLGEVKEREITIASRYNGKPVTGISNYAFDG